jgi:bacterioferritin-associated ferredoxin
MYVCICQSITDREIRKAVRRGARSVEDLRDELGVSAFCGSCAPLAESLVAETIGTGVAEAVAPGNERAGSSPLRGTAEPVTYVPGLPRDPSVAPA